MPDFAFAAQKWYFSVSVYSGKTSEGRKSLVTTERMERMVPTPSACIATSRFIW